MLSLPADSPALNARYGPSSSAEEYVVKSQVSALESHRAMFEAFGRNKYIATGVIQWMLVNAWPSHMWHLMDYCELCLLDLFRERFVLSERGVCGEESEW